MALSWFPVLLWSKDPRRFPGLYSLRGEYPPVLEGSAQHGQVPGAWQVSFSQEPTPWPVYGA